MRTTIAHPTNRKLVGWKIWCAVLDEQTPLGRPTVDEKDHMTVNAYRSSEHKWEDLPQYGVLYLKKFVILEGETKVRFNDASGMDAYIPDHKMLTGIPEADQWKYVKYGIWIPDLNYHPIRDFAYAEEDIIETIIG